MKEISSNFCKLSSVKNLFFKFFESFKVKVCGRKVFDVEGRLLVCKDAKRIEVHF